MHKKFCSIGPLDVTSCVVRYSFSVTRWLDYLFNIWAFTTMLICPKSLKLPEQAQDFAKYNLNPPKWPKTLKKFPSGKISQNLVTL